MVMLTSSCFKASEGSNYSSAITATSKLQHHLFSFTTLKIIQKLLLSSGPIIISSLCFLLSNVKDT